MQCPACARPVALARATCLYCGAPLPAEAVAAAEAACRALDGAAGAPGLDTSGSPVAPAAPPLTPPREESPARAIVVVDLTRADPAALGRALGLLAYEAGQRVRRGGWQLLRVGAAPDDDEAAALIAAGARLEVLPGDDVRLAEQPLVVLGGNLVDGRLELRSTEAQVSLAVGDLLLVVRGPITRRALDTEERSALARRARSPELWRHVAVHPEPGLRLHLHRRDDPRPVEIDPQSFEFGRPGAYTGASVVVLGRWVDALAAGAPIDEGFRHVTPALGPGQPETHSATAALDALRGARTGPARRRLDNLAQFRFYSAWRATVERRVRAQAD